MSVLTTLKALPSSYNRDLQEDKEPLFDSVDTVRASLEIFSAMVPELKINGEGMEGAATDPGLLATDIAEYLVKKGVPFREAHQLVGTLVARASEMNLALNNVSPMQMQEISPLFGEDLSTIFDVRRSLEKRRAIGAPSPQNITARLEHWRKILV
jgi:argininosuccinate lyase